MSLQNKIISFSICQFLTVGFYSFILGYHPVYLSDIEFASGSIAWVHLVSTLVSMIAGLLVLQLVSPRMSASFLLKFSSFVSIPLFYLFLISSSVLAVTISWSLFILFSMFSQTLFDVQLLKNNERGELRYERVRVWGSVGFIFFSFILGLSFEYFGSINATYGMLVLVSLRSLFALYVSSYMEDLSYGASSQFIGSGLISNMMKLPVILLLIIVALNWISHAPIFVYQSLYLRSLGWSGSEISLAWNLSVFGEILFFLNFKKIESYLRLETVLYISVLLTSVRWLMMGVTTNFYILLLSELLHAFSFGGCFLASIRLAYTYFPDPYKGKSQGVLSMFGVGLGSLIGRYGVKEVGSHYDSYNEYNKMFIWALGVSLLSCIVARHLRKIKLISPAS